MHVDNQDILGLPNSLENVTFPIVRFPGGLYFRNVQGVNFSSGINVKPTHPTLDGGRLQLMCRIGSLGSAGPARERV